MGGAKVPPAQSAETDIHTNSYTVVTATGEMLGLSVLPKDTSTWVSGAGDRTADPLIEG